MPATVLFLECKSYVIVGIYASISGFLLMCSDVWFSGRRPYLIIWLLPSSEAAAVSRSRPIPSDLHHTPQTIPRTTTHCQVICNIDFNFNSFYTVCFSVCLRCGVTLAAFFMSCDCHGVWDDFIVAFTLYLVCARCSKCVK